MINPFVIICVVVFVLLFLFVLLRDTGALIYMSNLCIRKPAGQRVFANPPGSRTSSPPEEPRVKNHDMERGSQILGPRKAVSLSSDVTSSQSARSMTSAYLVQHNSITTMASVTGTVSAATTCSASSPTTRTASALTTITPSSGITVTADLDTKGEFAADLQRREEKWRTYYSRQYSEPSSTMAIIQKGGRADQSDTVANSNNLPEEGALICL